MNYQQLLARDGNLVYLGHGNSMLPLIRGGRDLIVIVQVREPLKKYDVALYQRDSGEYVLHRIVGIRPDGYVLCGDNCWRREYGIQDRHMVGVLTAVIRDGRMLPVSSMRYRAYSLLWCGFYPLRAIWLIATEWTGKLRNRLKKFFREYR